MKLKHYQNFVHKGDHWLINLYEDLDITQFQYITGMKILHISKYSFIIGCKNHKDLALKLIKPQSYPRDMLRKYIFSQAKREVIASHKLKELGVSCPKTFGYAFSLSPVAKYESILFVEYKRNILTGYEFLKTVKDTSLRSTFLQNVAKDISKIYCDYYHNKDCRFGNMLVGKNIRPIWIDNDLRKIRRTKDVGKYFNQTLNRLKKSCADQLTDAEWNFFYKMTKYSIITNNCI